MPRFASIDIGSNTLRLLIMDAGTDGTCKEVYADRAITRLGEGMDSTRRLQPHRIKSSLDVLERFSRACKEHGDPPVFAVATSAVREAVNRDEFIAGARERAGLSIDVISWEEEARLTLAGVFWKIPDTGELTVTFDIGGGSTEFIRSRGTTAEASVGTLLGSVRLTEKFLSRHPVIDSEYNNLLDHIRQEMAHVRLELGGARPARLIGTAGTVTTLAALIRDIHPYDPERVHGAVLTLEELERLQDSMKSKSLAERLLMKPLERGREDVIIAGAAIALQALSTFGCAAMTVSDHGLREGILLDAVRRSTGQTR